MMEPMRQNALTVPENPAGEGSTQFNNSRGTAISEEHSTALFPSNETEDLRSKWERVQANFVDDPRNAVKDADNLVSVATKRLAEIFAGERNKLEHEWDRGDDVSTEDLRLALRRYRSFFDRLLSV